MINIETGEELLRKDEARISSDNEIYLSIKDRKITICGFHRSLVDKRYLDSDTPFIQNGEFLESVYAKFSGLLDMYKNIKIPKFTTNIPEEGKGFYDGELNPYKIEEFYNSIYELYMPETDKSALVHAYVFEQNGSNAVKIKVVHDIYGVYKAGDIIQLYFESVEDTQALLKIKEFIIKI
jgi:hypothetical protein